MASNRLLVIDDIPASSATIGRVARGCGYDTIITTDADDCRSRILSWNPSVIVLDLTMPEMDGLQLMEWLAVRHSKARLLIVSGREPYLLREAEEIGRALGLNVAGSLQKPLRLESLRTILREIYLDAGILSVQDLSNALSNREIRLEYQPQVDMRTGQVLGFEALARWDHPAYGLLPPDKFIPDLEAIEVMDDFTFHVVESAIEDLRHWNGSLDSRLSINVSASNFKAMEIDEVIREKCAGNDTEIQRLTIEVTETAALADSGRIIGCLNRLENLGVQVSIDDFGTGYSSLTKLHAIPCTELKIDKSFVENCRSNPQSGILVRSMIELGHNLNKRIVAEGVEDEPTRRQLHAWGCDVEQGFLISKSLPASHVRQWFTEYSSESRNGWN